jgi:Tol biopolymer transport system component/PKD repeat protein
MKRRMLSCIAALLVLTMVLVVVGCSLPQATFDASVTSGTALLKVDFTNKTSTGMFKKADEFQWDFGDGGTMTTKNVKDPVSHDYTKAGTFTVTLTVVKNGEPPKTSAMSLNITVAHGPLDHVQLSPKSVDLDIGQSQQFTSSVVDAYGNPISEAEVTWAAADGAGSISQNGVLGGGTKAGTYEEGVTVTAALGTLSTQDSASVTIKPDPLDIVTISPIVVSVGETKLLSTTATDKYGNPLNDVAVIWSVLDHNAGSITPDGSFKAGEVANHYTDAVEVQVKQGDVSRTAMAAIEVTAGALDKMYIAPNPADIGIGMTQQFVAVGADRFGNRITDIDINWSVVNSGGSIDNNGLFTAGTTPDVYQNTVKAEATLAGVTKSATVDVTVEQDRIAFLSDRDNSKNVCDIYTMDIDGKNQTRLTTNNANLGRFTSSLDGRRIIYVLESEAGDMYTISDDGKWLFPIEQGQMMFEPNMSPDGKKIAFQSWATGSGEICVMDVDGGNVVQLTNTGNYNDYPSWSPDGTKIVFLSERDGNDEIYVMNADGTHQQRLTNNNVVDWWPRWSPDGTSILYQSDDGTKFIIKTMDADGTDSRVAINVSYSCNWPSWSPDGTKILFHAWADPNQAEIYMADADGSNITRLTNNTADDYGPLWLPRKAGVAISPASVIIPQTGKYSQMTAQQVTDMASGAVVRLKTDLATGSGFLISSDGLILTANHMVTDAKEITVYLSDGKSYTATVKARDLVHDLALIKIGATGLPYLQIGDSIGIGLGQQVIVLGYPLGNENLTVTSGLVSSIDYDNGRNITWVQTDSAINPGNSGGPMLDLQGNVIGIVTAKLIGLSIENVGFAISVSTIDLYLAMLESGQNIYQ